MKSIKLMLLVILTGMVSLMSCSTETQQLEVENKQTTIKVLPNEVNKGSLEFRFVRDEKGNLDFTKIEVINSTSRAGEWQHCGGGVFTDDNGNTYMYIARDADYPNALRAYDEFIDEYYYYTVHWCSCTCTNKSVEKSDVEKEVIEIVNYDISIESRPSVSWCPSHGNPHKLKDGFGIAQVTLDDGSVHYVSAQWENHGVCCGRLIYQTYYIGGSLPSGWSC